MVVLQQVTKITFPVHRHTSYSPEQPQNWSSRWRLELHATWVTDESAASNNQKTRYILFACNLGVYEQADGLYEQSVCMNRLTVYINRLATCINRQAVWKGWQSVWTGWVCMNNLTVLCVWTVWTICLHEQCVCMYEQYDCPIWTVCLCEQSV